MYKYNNVLILAASSITASKDEHSKDNYNNQSYDQRRSDEAYNHIHGHLRVAVLAQSNDPINTHKSEGDPWNVNMADGVK